MLKRMNVSNPTHRKKKRQKDVEEHHAIHFMLGANKYKYGKSIEV